ncbi:MAG: ThiF family adenylyltransferase [candidate division Zixibacteria bacterium]|nr:ThiF family adenylyltransferase [candidate division Zixibacteria bacterium]
MLNDAKIPEVVLEAYDLLLQYRIVDVTKPLYWNHTSGRKGWIFDCVVSVPYPNPENIPAAVDVQVCILEGFPFLPVDIFSNCEEVKGFPHQDSETGKLCLPAERLAPRNAERLVHYVNWAKNWLTDAANANLLKPGDPYELPDFSRKLLGESFPTDFPILFNETEKSYEKWKPYIGKSGIVECFVGNCIPAIFAVRFSDNSSIVWESEFSSGILDQDKKLIGNWLILPDIRFKRHRPPQTYREITQLCSANDLDFYDILKEAWKVENRDPEIGLILIGFPIPKIYGEKPIEMHWQPLVFPNLRVERKSVKCKSIKLNRIWKRLQEHDRFKFAQQLPWGKSSNVADDRIYARGSYSRSIRSARVAIFGCGALGSLIAELLTRGGVRVLYLFDPKNIQIGNFCRHTLDGTFLGFNKAKSLAWKLSRTNPLSTIIGYPIGIPLSPSSQNDAYKSLSRTDIIINSTASESAFDWLNKYATVERKQIISLFFNFHAELITLLISGRETSCDEIFQDLMSCVKKEQLPITSQEYLYQPSREEQIIEGAGCWHPTFPALNAHIYVLTATAMDIINHHIEQGDGKGLVVIIKRNSLNSKVVQSSPFVEIVWTNQYP